MDIDRRGPVAHRRDHTEPSSVPLEPLPGVSADTSHSIGSDSSPATIAPDQEVGHTAVPAALGQVGLYRLIQLLGKGGMGAVYLAEDTVLRRSVAVKKMHPEIAAHPVARQRFLREARAAALFTHDHIVTLFHIGEENDTPYLVMQLLEGTTLDERLRQENPLPLADVLRIGREVALGLVAAHGRGLIHRDIKPSNIWLEKENSRVKILDFGLVRTLEADNGMTGVGGIVGTPAYMAPEQARGEVVDPRCDLFSLGCVLFRMATGQSAFAGASVPCILLAVTTHTPPSAHEVNPKVPLSLSLLIQQLLEKDRDRRPATALDVVEALRGIERTRDETPLPRGSLQIVPSEGKGTVPSDQDGPGAAPALPVQVEEPAKRPSRRFALVTLGVGLAACAATALLVMVIRIETPRSTVVISSDEPDLNVQVKRDGIILLTTNDRTFSLSPGEVDLEIFERKSGLRLHTDKFILGRDRRVMVKVERRKSAVATPLKEGNPISKPPPKQVEEPLPPVKGSLEARHLPFQSADPGEDSVSSFAIGTDGTRWALGPRREGEHYPLLRWDGRRWVSQGARAATLIAVHDRDNVWDLNHKGEVYSNNIHRYRTHVEGGPAIDVACAPDGLAYVLGGHKQGDDWPVLVARDDDRPELDVHNRMRFLPVPGKKLRGVRLVVSPRGPTVVTIRASGDVYFGPTHLAGIKAIDVAVDGAGNLFILAPEKNKAGEHFVHKYNGDFKTAHRWQGVPGSTGVRIVGDNKEGIWLLSVRGLVRGPVSAK